MPAIDSTEVVGPISLSGAMTGLILGGVDQRTTIRYGNVVLLRRTGSHFSTRISEMTLFDWIARTRGARHPRQRCHGRGSACIRRR